MSARDCGLVAGQSGEFVGSSNHSAGRLDVAAAQDIGGVSATPTLGTLEKGYPGQTHGRSLRCCTVSSVRGVFANAGNAIPIVRDSVEYSVP